MADIEWEPMAEIQRSTVAHNTWLVTRLGLLNRSFNGHWIHGKPVEEVVVYDVPDGGLAAGPQRVLKAWVLLQLEWAEFDRHRWVKVKGSEDHLELQVAWRQVPA